MIALFVLLSGCSYKYLVVYDGDVYLGAFNHEKKEAPGCIYSSIEGSGIKLGTATFGLGYFSNKKMEIDKNLSSHCESKIGEVFVVDKKLSEESVTFK
ncbi:hypothetical protein [Vibrio sp. MEBiC08052]|uniref:hypothetical protein n=1 Tax=Vibrio sp. MEBiC08052 TaxID=1761910 RepID=UPI0012FA59C6|nr:hypothetical protein [Vibrio sp. MEBiC08052]